MVEQRLPGLAVGVVRDQELAWFQGFGFADVASQRRPDEETLFRVASITKTFTATCVLQLRDAGKLTLDDPLVRHVPEYKAVKPRAGSVEGVTLRERMAELREMSGRRYGQPKDSLRQQVEARRDWSAIRQQMNYVADVPVWGK